MKISVLLPTFNHGKYLQQCLDGIANQTYKNIEVIIINDGSTDRTKIILNKYQKKHNAWKVFHFKKNLGLKNAVKKLFLESSGEYFISIASDDILINKTFFEQAISLVIQNPEAAGAFGKTDVRNSNLQRSLWEMGTASKAGYISADEATDLFFKNKLFVPGTSSIWRRKYFDEVGGFDFRLGAQSDYFINHVLPMKYGAFFLNEVVAIMRKSENSYSGKVNNKTFFTNHAKFEKKVRQALNPNKNELSNWEVWRKSVINARLNIELNTNIKAELDKIFYRVHEWEKDALAPYITKIMQIFYKEAKPFDERMKEQERQAHNIFNKEAGPISDTFFYYDSSHKSSMVKKALLKLRAFFK